MLIALHLTFVRRVPAILLVLLLLLHCSVNPLVDTHLEKNSPRQQEVFSSVTVLPPIFLPISKQNASSPSAPGSAFSERAEISCQLVQLACTENSVVNVIPLSAYLKYTETTSSRL